MTYDRSVGADRNNLLRNKIISKVQMQCPPSTGRKRSSQIASCGKQFRNTPCTVDRDPIAGYRAQLVNTL